MLVFSPTGKKHSKPKTQMVFSQKMSSDPTMVDHAIIWIFTHLTEVASVLVAICLPLVIIASYCAYRMLQQMDAKEAHLAAVKAAQKHIAEEASATVKTKGGKSKTKSA